MEAFFTLFSHVAILCLFHKKKKAMEDSTASQEADYMAESESDVGEPDIQVEALV
jgi:hypothetical protein